MAINPEKNISQPVRYTLGAFIFFLSIAAFYALYPHFISQYCYLKGKQYQKKGYSGLALRYFKKASSYQPKDTITLNRVAKTFFNIGLKKQAANEAFIDILKAKDAYLQSTHYNPMDVETAYGLMRVESQLEQLYEMLYPNNKNNPYHPLPYFERTVQLKPNGITYRYDFARYLYRHNETDALYRQIYDIIRLYPPAYNHLKKEAMWSSRIKKIAKSALLDAIKQNISTETAHKIMSSSLVEDKDWPNAIVHYKKALEFKKNRISERDYITIGGLYLKNNQPKDAESNFIKGMNKSSSIERTFSNISRIYKDANRIDEYTSFYQNANKRFIFSPKMHIISARYLIDLKQYQNAHRILTDLNRESRKAEAYYWLFKIAERKKDWNQMELSIQKATVIEPSNNRYRQIFYRVLKRFGKYETAENQLDLIIKHSEKPSDRLFDERARLRLRRKNYDGAIKDWESAIHLLPQKATYYASVAEAYIKLGDLSKALAYYKKAVQLNPGNEGYAVRFKKLKS